MISGANSCFQQSSQGLQMYNALEDMLSASSAAMADTSSSAETNSNALLYNLSILREKVQQAQSLVDVIVSSDQAQHESITVAIAGTGTIVQEIIVTASSMMYTCQKMALIMVQNNGSSLRGHDEMDSVIQMVGESGRGYFNGETLHLYHSNLDNDTTNEEALCGDDEKNDRFLESQPMSCDIIELDAAELLAKFTHYCQVCGKGFKRDANLRMHMRAHGDEYKSNAALSNPMKKGNITSIGHEDCFPLINSPRKYSCPQEGCRWNKKHAKFQPLKSMVCVKNHYRRSHCPKMYVCNRCNRKQFSVLSDLRTHEKHCGYAKWKCSCGTTFSRKDKLMGHVALFIGHLPADNCYVKVGKSDRRTIGI